MAHQRLCPNTQCGKTFSMEIDPRKSVICPACQTIIAGAEETISSEPPPDPSASQKKVTIQSIGRIVLKAKLGSGAFGTVRLAYVP